jgi:hypothetical protein
VEMASADLGETAEDELDGQEDDDQEDEDERAGHTRRWVRYVMPVMVEVDCDTDEIASVVTLPGEVRLDRDDMMNMCIYDEAFPRRPTDEQLQAHALYVSEPEWACDEDRRRILSHRLGRPDLCTDPEQYGHTNIHGPARETPTQEQRSAEDEAAEAARLAAERRRVRRRNTEWRDATEVRTSHLKALLARKARRPAR